MALRGRDGVSTRRSTCTITFPLFAFTGLALLATLLNPYGWGAWQYAIEIANMKASAGIVDEWAASSRGFYGIEGVGAVGLTEVKFENAINRINSVANPR